MDQEGVAVDDEVGGDDVRGTGAWVADGELAEIVPGEPVAPLGVADGGIPGVDQHVRVLLLVRAVKR
jgi:hypothetical protein